MRASDAWDRECKEQTTYFRIKIPILLIKRLLRKLGLRREERK